MSISLLNRQKASSRARIAQGLLGVLVVAGGGALAVGLHAGPKVDVPSGGVTIPAYDLGSKSATAATPVQLDLVGVAARFDQVSNHPTPIEVVEQPKSAQAALPPPPPPPSTETKYLGAVSMGSKAMALITDAGKQRFVGVGDKLGDDTIESISEDQIKVGGKNPRTIELASRGSDVLTHGRGRQGQGVPQMAGKAPGQPGQPVPVNQGLATFKPMPAAPGGGGVPEYIKPEQAGRYQELVDQLRKSGPSMSEPELQELAGKTVTLEQTDPGEAKKLLTGLQQKGMKEAAVKARSQPGGKP